MSLAARGAGLVARWALAPTAALRVEVVSDGHAPRHKDRGETAEGRRARHKLEDASSTAGARTPTETVAAMPRVL